jgi:transposase
MKTIMMKGSKKSADSPTGPPEGAFGATGGGPVGGGHDTITTPDPEVDPQKRRRKLTAKYKLRILQEAEQCRDSQQIGFLLRREGLYSSSLTRWRRLRDQGILRAMKPKTRGRKPSENNPLAADNAKLQKENQLLRKKLWKAERIIEVQKKISEILGIQQDLNDLENGD